MKKKSLIIMLSIIGFIVLVVVLSSTIFSLKKVNLTFYSNTLRLTNKNEEIISSGNFKYNQSIFFIDKKKYISNLEKNNPYLKVINIETNFPNSLTINALERNELFVIKTYQDNSFKNYSVVDDEFKILDTTTSFVNSSTNPIVLNIEGYNYNALNLGEFFKNSDYDNCLSIISNELLAYNNNILLLKANFAEITLNYEGKNNILIKMHSGVEILLKDYSNKLESKFRLALSYYDTQSPEKQEKGRITVFENNEQQIEGYYYS